MTRYIVLLRGINVNSRSLPMQDLRDAVRAGGFPDCVTYIQSGNLVLSAAGGVAGAGGVEAAIEALIAARFGMKMVAIARAAEDFTRIAAANPLPDAESNLLHLCLTKAPPVAEATVRLAERARHGERIVASEGALWIDFAGGVGTSKLTPAAMDKAAGSTLTARNWNTVRKLLALAAE